MAAGRFRLTANIGCWGRTPFVDVHYGNEDVAPSLH